MVTLKGSVILVVGIVIPAILGFVLYSSLAPDSSIPAAKHDSVEAPIEADLNLSEPVEREEILSKALQDFSDGKFEDAETKLLELEANAPSNVQVLSLLALVYDNMDLRHQESLDYLEKLITLDSANPQYFDNYLNAIESLDQHPRGLHFLSDYQGIDEVLTLSAIARLKWSGGDPQNAVRTLDQAVLLEGQRTGKPISSFDLVTKLIERDPENENLRSFQKHIEQMSKTLL